MKSESKSYNKVAVRYQGRCNTQLPDIGIGVENLDRTQVRCGSVVCKIPELELGVDEWD